jgi:superfamily II DNA helicase RecQ
MIVLAWYLLFYCSVPAASVILPSVPTYVWLSTRQSGIDSNAADNAKAVDPQEQQIQARDALYYTNTFVMSLMLILQMDLYAKLIALRNEIADETSLPSYRVFSNKNLIDMAKFR